MKQILLLVFVLLGITTLAYSAFEHDVVNAKDEPVYLFN